MGSPGTHDHARYILWLQLLFAFTLDGEAGPRSSTTALKGLGLAVRGALESICGEATRIMRLRHGEHGDVVLAFAHLQACMVVLALPGWMPDSVAGGMVLQLAQTLVYLAGPSPEWTVQQQEAGKGTAYAMIKKPLLVLFDRLCEGTLTQLSGPGWSKVLPACIMETGVLFLHLEAEQHRLLASMVRAHEVGGLAGAAPRPPTFSRQAAPMQFDFYSRSCCLMYRGLTVWSGLPPAQTRLTWQLCWALGAHGQAQALPCQVTMHRVHPAVPGPVSEAVDTSGGGEEVSGEAPAAATLSQGSGGGGRAQRSLLILVSACHLVLAVVLTAYDEDIEELAGQVEAHTAVELLSKLHGAFAPHMDSAVAASALLQAVARPLTETTSGGQHGGSPGSKGPRALGKARGSLGGPPGGGGGAGGGGGSLFMRIVSRTRSKMSRLAEQQSGGGPGEAQSPRAWSGGGPRMPGSPQLDPLTASGGSPLGSPSASAVGRRSLPASPSQLPPSSLLRNPAVGGHRASTLRGGGGSSFVPAGGTISENTPPDLPSTLSLPAGYGLQISMPHDAAAPEARVGTTASSPAGWMMEGMRGSTAMAYSPSPRDGSPTASSAPPASTATYAVIELDVETGSITTYGDVPHLGMAAEIWSIISACRAMFGSGGMAVTAPPRHSRLCMTIQQIEQLSATRSQREGGQRLGSADAAPWQYHPEVAALANAQQVTRRLESSKKLLGPHAPNWYVTACKRSENREIFVVHSEEVDEAAVLNDVFCHPRDHRAQPAYPLPSALGGQQLQPATRVVGKPNAARHLGLGAV